MQDDVGIHEDSESSAKSEEQRAKSSELRVKTLCSVPYSLHSMLYALSSRLRALCSMLRYRFFFFAGIFPYLLGQTLAFHVKNSIHWQYFWWGFLGISFVLIGVELFNEYFDAKIGGDRIFLEGKPDIPNYFFPFALCSMLFAFFISLYLTSRLGWPILLFSFLGFLASYFYVGPPIRWAYRGLGEIVIALSYGPLMVVGSYYLQTRKIDFLPLAISLILGLLIFSLAIVNEIPDYFQDKLVGKKNLVVRLGKEKSTRIFSLSLLCVFALLGLGIGFKKIPFLYTVAFLSLPLVLKSIKIAQNNYDNPKFFLPAIRITALTYIIVLSSLLGISYLI
jgi:1,4-dihydroxy-2-naphthoate octaprenyltransferase